VLDSEQCCPEQCLVRHDQGDALGLHLPLPRVDEANAHLFRRPSLVINDFDRSTPLSQYACLSRRKTNSLSHIARRRFGSAVSGTKASSPPAVVRPGPALRRVRSSAVVNALYHLMTPDGDALARRRQAREAASADHALEVEVPGSDAHNGLHPVCVPRCAMRCAACRRDDDIGAEIADAAYPRTCSHSWQRRPRKKGPRLRLFRASSLTTDDRAAHDDRPRPTQSPRWPGRLLIDEVAWGHHDSPRHSEVGTTLPTFSALEPHAGPSRRPTAGRGRRRARNFFLKTNLEALSGALRPPLRTTADVYRRKKRCDTDLYRLP
jgi:hypothetical protein